MITAAVSFKASLKPKRFFFLALFLLIAFPPFRFFCRFACDSATVSRCFLFCQAIFGKNIFCVRLCGRFFVCIKSLKNKIGCFYIYLYISDIHAGEIIS